MTNDLSSSKNLDSYFDIWINIAGWSSLTFACVYLIAGIFFSVALMNSGASLLYLPVILSLCGALYGFLTGGILGAIVAGLYNVNGFELSWTSSFVWAIVGALLLIYNSMELGLMSKIFHPILLAFSGEGAGRVKFIEETNSVEVFEPVTASQR